MIRRQQGMFMITVLALVVFLVMFASAVTVYTLQSARVAGRVNQFFQARNIAFSGLEFAKVRMLEAWNGKQTHDNVWYSWELLWRKEWWGWCPYWENVRHEEEIVDKENAMFPWRGGGYGNPISSNELVVNEHFDSSKGTGWVEGWAKSNPEARFYIFFKKPTDVEMRSDSVFGTLTPRFCSVNNFDNFKNSRQNRMISPTDNPEDGELYRDVPPAAADIIVQGRCGTAEVHVESILYIEPSEEFTSAITTHKSLDLTINNIEGTWQIDSMQNKRPEIRVAGDLKVVPGEGAINLDAELPKECLGLVGGQMNGDFTILDKLRDNGFKDGNGLTDQEESTLNTAKNLKINSLDEVVPDDSKEKEVATGAYLFKIDDGEIKLYHSGDGDLEFAYEGNISKYHTTYNNFMDAIEVDVSDGTNVRHIDLKSSRHVAGNEKIVGYRIKEQVNLKKKNGSTANNFQIVTDSPYTPYMVFGTEDVNKSDTYLKNTNGPITLDAMICGDGGLYATGDIKFNGKAKNVQGGATQEALNVVSTGGSVTINSNYTKDYKMIESRTEQDPETGEEVTTHYTKDSEMERMYGVFSDGSVPVEDPEDPVEPEDPQIPDEDQETDKDQAQYVAQAILAQWQANGSKDPYGFNLNDDFCKNVASRQITFQRNGKELAGKTSLYNLLKKKFGQNSEKVNSYIRTLIEINSSKLSGNWGNWGNFRILSNTNINVLKKIAINKSSKEKVGKGETHTFKGYFYAKNEFKFDRDTDSLTIQGSLIAGKGNIIAGNFNSIYDSTSLKQLYGLFDCSIKDLFRATVK